MNVAEFLLLTLTGSLVWNSILAAAGVIFGQYWGQVLSIVETYELAMWLILGVLVAVFVVRRVGD